MGKRIDCRQCEECRNLAPCGTDCSPGYAVSQAGLHRCEGKRMARLEELTRGAAVRGVLADGLATVVDVQWFGSDALELTYKDAAGRLGSELVYRDHEPTLEIEATIRDGAPENGVRTVNENARQLRFR